MIARLLASLRERLRRRQVDDEIAEELHDHLEREIAAHRSRGVPPDEARRLALRDLGGLTQTMESAREVRATWLDSVWGDVRYAVRVLWRAPLFTLTASLSLAIGVGTVVAVFTVANGLLLRPASGVADPDSLVDVIAMPKQSPDGVTPVSLAAYEAIHARTATLQGVYAYALEPVAMSLRSGASTSQAFATPVTPTYFDVLGVTASAGRIFAAGEFEHGGRWNVAVISDDFWRRRFNGDRAIVGQSIDLNAAPVTIIGVAAAGFLGTSVTAPDLWLPIPPTGVVDGIAAGSPTDSFRAWLMLGARLKPGVSRAQSAAEIAVIGESLARPPSASAGTVPRFSAPLRWNVVAASPIPFGLRGLATLFLMVLLGIVSIVLLIATTNVSGVLLARAVSRRREIAVRAAMGASRRRIVRQLLTETTLLFLLAGGLGLALAGGLTSLLVWLLPVFPVPVHLSVPLDWRVSAFSLGLSLVAALCAGLSPAREASRLDVIAALKDQWPVGADRRRLRYAFVITQVALSAMLVVIGGLLFRKMERDNARTSQQDASRILVATLDGSTAVQQMADVPLAEDLLARARAMPGVEAAALADRLPVNRRVDRRPRELSVSGSPAGDTSAIGPSVNIVSPGYFTTLGIPLLQGRDFEATDRAGAPSVTIVSAAAARRYWSDQDALGKSLTAQLPGGPGDLPKTIALRVVGIAKDQTDRTTGSSGSPDIYVPVRQMPPTKLSLLARSANPDQAIGDIRALIAAAAPHVALPDVQRLSSLQTGPVETQVRIAMSVAGSVGVIGIVLAVVGIHGITAYVVTRRKQEFAVRLALGAEHRTVMTLALSSGMALVCSGLGLGLVLGGAAGRILGASPIGAIALDPLVFAATTAIFVLAGLAACYVPARHASRVDPMNLLRSQ